MAAAKPRVKVPKTASKGEVVTIKTLISHKMESGQRKDSSGNVIPRQIINRFTCDMNGQTVFACDLEPAISANPYIEFTVKMEETAKLTFSWTDDDGTVSTSDATIEVA